MASPANPIRSVRRWCRKWAPGLTTKQLNEIVERTKTSNKRWSHDQSAAVLEVSLDDNIALRFRFIGAHDDPDYVRRRVIQRAKDADRKRLDRAKNRTGAKRGRPAHDLSPDDKLVRSNAQAAERMRRHRALRKNASGHLIDIGNRTEFSVTHLPSKPETLSSQDRRKPAPIPSKTALIEWKDTRFREPTPNQGISEEEATLNAWCGHMDLKRGHKTPMTERMIMRKVHRDIANELGLKNNRLRFDIFKSWHTAKGIWSQDWTETWRNWCVDDVRREAEWGRKERARAYFEKLRQEAHQSTHIDWRA
jgi:hypothetical protein